MSVLALVPPIISDGRGFSSKPSSDASLPLYGHHQPGLQVFNNHVGQDDQGPVERRPRSISRRDRHGDLELVGHAYPGVVVRHGQPDPCTLLAPRRHGWCSPRRRACLPAVPAVEQRQRTVGNLALEPHLPGAPLTRRN